MLNIGILNPSESSKCEIILREYFEILLFKTVNIIKVEFVFSLSVSLNQLGDLIVIFTEPFI